MRDIAERGVTPYIRLIGATAADVRDVMVDGASGILAVSDPHFRPRHIPSRRLLEWPNGVQAHTFSADEPDRLRGPEFGFEWWDEWMAWKYPKQAMDNALPGLRFKTPGWEPCWVITTTPKPVPVLRELMADPTTAITKGSTYENVQNLARTFMHKIVARYEGTDVGRQELLAEILEDVKGANWNHKIINDLRIPPGTEPGRREMRDVYVAVDPPGTKHDAKPGEEEAAEARGGEAGIVVVASGPCPRRFAERADLKDKLHGYVLEDKSGNMAPLEWAQAAVDAFRDHEATAIVAEVNHGGDMVAAMIHQINASIPVIQVRASEGKYARAQPVAMKYQQELVHHVGGFGKLEDQMASYTKDAKWSPDRMDALVWGLTKALGLGVAITQLVAPSGTSSPSTWVPG